MSGRLHATHHARRPAARRRRAAVHQRGESPAAAQLLSLQREAGNGAVAELVQRELEKGGGGKDVSFEFNAFIPQHLGKAFKDLSQPKGLVNQDEFDAKVGAVDRTWLKEPGPGLRDWYCSTDDRDFGGGSHRLGFRGTINTANLGKLATMGDVFAHDCYASHRVRSYTYSLGGSTRLWGDVEGPLAETATAHDKEETRTDVGSATSSVSTTAQASYAFMPTVSPDIDYEVKLTLTRAGDGAIVKASMTHNEFPFYELLVNGTPVYKYSAKDKGPTLINLNSSTKASVSTTV